MTLGIDLAKYVFERAASMPMALALGLVPRQLSSGDRRMLMGIRKRGDQHLRTFLALWSEPQPERSDPLRI